MSFTFGREPGPASVTIDHERCSDCGLCVTVCKGAALFEEGGRVVVDLGRAWGCMACGQCVAVCPSDAIRVAGRDLYPEDVLPIPPRAERTGYDALYARLLARRSVRDFAPHEVAPELVERILQAASTAPMGLPPSEVGVLVVAGRERVTHLRDGLLDEALKVGWLFSPPALTLMRPFLGRESTAMLRQFVAPILALYEQKRCEGVDWFFYGAPLALYFYGSPLSDPADAVIAATYAMLAAESLDLGSCMLGFPGYILKYSRRLQREYGLPSRHQTGLMLAIGHPALHYSRALRRRFGTIHSATN